MLFPFQPLSSSSTFPFHTFSLMPFPYKFNSSLEKKVFLKKAKKKFFNRKNLKEPILFLHIFNSKTSTELFFLQRNIRSLSSISYFISELTNPNFPFPKQVSSYSNQSKITKEKIIIFTKKSPYETRLFPSHNFMHSTKSPNYLSRPQKSRLYTAPDDTFSYDLKPSSTKSPYINLRKVLFSFPYLPL